MPRQPRLVHLTTVVGSFHAKVVVARLLAEGIRTELRGYSDGPYPLPSEIEVLVAEDELELASEVLLADAVDAAFIESDDPRPVGRRRLFRR